MKHFVAVICSIIFAFIASAQNASEKISPSVWAAFSTTQAPTFFVVMEEQADLSAAAFLSTKEEKGAYVFNTLQQTAMRSQKSVIDFLKSQNTDFQSFWIVNALVVKGDATLVRALASRPDVAQILPNSKVVQHYFKENTPLETRNVLMPEWGILKIKADSVWALGYRGQGVVIGGQDTGYDWAHPAIKKKYRGWDEAKGTAEHNYNWHDAIRSPADSTDKNPCGFGINTPCDDNAHGTHTMGTMVGSTETDQIGVAPDARWVGVRNMEEGFGTLRSYTESFQWFIAPTDSTGRNPRVNLAPHVINNSWYCSVQEGCNATNFAILERAVNACRAAGIVVVVSGGNSGSSCSSMTGPPAFFNQSFSVGATNSNDSIASFSSRGPVAIDMSSRRKPDVSAPGVIVRSSVPGGRYSAFSGTSMAGPHVAGLVALMISANPKLAGQVDTIQRIIEQTAKPLTSSQTCGDSALFHHKVPNNIYGYGRIDALAAVKRALLYRTATTPTTDVMTTAGRFKVFPNPVADNLTIYRAASSAQNSSVTEPAPIQSVGRAELTLFTLFNLNGQMMIQQSLNLQPLESATITVASLPKGLYFYTLKNGNEWTSGKVFKY